MAKYKIVHDRPEFIGCGNCESNCPDYWEMTDDGRSHLKGSQQEGKNEVLENETIACNQDAAESCLVNCIHIYEEGRKTI